MTPAVVGDIEALDGDVYFQDRKFKILNGRLSFINPSGIEPYLSFKGETYVKDYRVTFSLDGPPDRLTARRCPGASRFGRVFQAHLFL
jgi:hypothetical protein